MFLFTSLQETGLFGIEQIELVRKRQDTFFATRLVLIRTFVNWLERVKQVDQSFQNGFDLDAPLKLGRVIIKDMQIMPRSKVTILKFSLKRWMELKWNTISSVIIHSFFHHFTSRSKTTNKPKFQSSWSVTKMTSYTPPTEQKTVPVCCVFPDLF